MYREKSSITKMGENFFEVDTKPTPNRTNEILFSQLPNTLGYSVIGYAGAQPHIFQRFTTSSLNKLVEALNSSPNSKRPAAIGPTGHYGTIEDFTIISSEKSAAPLASAKGKVPTRDFPLEYPEDSRKALEGNLRHWAYICVEDRTFLRPLFLLMKPASFHPLVTNMIPVLFKLYYAPNNLKLLNKKVDLKEFYDAGLAQLVLSLVSTIQQAGLDSTTADTGKKLGLFPAEQREFWRFIIEPAQLQTRMKSEFKRLEQEVEVEKKGKSGNLNPLCSLALCYIWGWGCEQNIDKAIEYLEAGVKETETFKEARGHIEGVPSSDILEANETLAHAYEILGHLYSYKGDQKKARTKYTELANINSNGNLHLANYYFMRNENVTRTENAMALRHVETAVEKRNPIALRAWIKWREENRKKKGGRVSQSSDSE
ncbi:MAG: sel1 repeat family protein, partial [Alphaproteobacteria bacterium]|nr:sel1 repeat family protein [Alphaproteobacteria bacterium]